MAKEELTSTEVQQEAMFSMVINDQIVGDDAVNGKDNNVNDDDDDGERKCDAMVRHGAMLVVINDEVVGDDEDNVVNDRDSKGNNDGDEPRKNDGDIQREGNIHSYNKANDNEQRRNDDNCNGGVQNETVQPVKNNDKVVDNDDDNGSDDGNGNDKRKNDCNDNGSECQDEMRGVNDIVNDKAIDSSDANYQTRSNDSICKDPIPGENDKNANDGDNAISVGTRNVQESNDISAQKVALLMVSYNNSSSNDKVNENGNNDENTNGNRNGISVGCVRQEATTLGNNNDDIVDVNDKDHLNGQKDKKKRKAKTERGPSAKSDDVECAWSWVVLAGSILTGIIGAGQVQCINIYFVVFLEEFKKSTSFTAWISAAQSTALCVAGPLSSFLLPKMGARLTIIMGGILMAACLVLVSFANSIPYLIVVYAFLGASQCLLTSGNLATISLYFRRRASFATGIMLAGAGIGSMLTGLELEWSIETFGWRGAMLIQAGIVLNICVSGSLVYSRKSKPNQEKKQIEAKQNGVAIISHGDDHTSGNKKKLQKDDISPAEQTSLRHLCLNPLFWLAIVSIIGVQANWATMLTIFKGYVISVGLEASFKTVLTTAGMGSMVGRLLSGPLGQLLCPPLHMAAVAAMCALANALYILVDRPWTLAVVGGVYGFCQGQMIVAYILCLSWVFGQKEMPVVRGHVIFFGALPGMICPPIAGYTVDLTGNYNVALMMSAAATFSCCLCGVVTYFVHRKRAQSRSKRSYDVNITSQPATNDVTSDAKDEHYAPYIPV